MEEVLTLLQMYRKAIMTKINMLKKSFCVFLIFLLIIQLTSCSGGNVTEDLYINKVFNNINWNSTQEDIKNNFKDYKQEVVTEDNKTKIIYNDVEIFGEKTDAITFIFSTTTVKEKVYDMGLCEFSVGYAGDKEYAEKIKKKIEETFKEELKDAKETLSADNDKIEILTAGYTDYTIIPQKNIDKHLEILKEAYGDTNPNITPSIEEYKKEFLVSISSINAVREEEIYSSGVSFNATKLKFLQALE